MKTNIEIRNHFLKSQIIRTYPRFSFTQRFDQQKNLRKQLTNLPHIKNSHTKPINYTFITNPLYSPHTSLKKRKAPKQTHHRAYTRGRIQFSRVFSYDQMSFPRGSSTTPMPAFPPTLSLSPWPIEALPRL